MARPVLLTAGATRNPVDAIRYLSARATGVTALEIARRLLVTHPVHLLGSAEACLRAGDSVPTEEFGSTRDLMARVERWLRAHPRGVFVHSAAVGDYEMADPEAGKIPSGQAEITLRLVPAPKILDQVRGWAPDCHLVSFKAGAPGLTEGQLEAIARAQLQRTGSDLVWANALGALTTVLLVGPKNTTRHARREDAVADLSARILATS